MGRRRGADVLTGPPWGRAHLHNRVSLADAGRSYQLRHLDLFHDAQIIRPTWGSHAFALRMPFMRR